jgi:hypothetical protein
MKDELYAIPGKCINYCVKNILDMFGLLLFAGYPVRSAGTV